MPSTKINIKAYSSVIVYEDSLGACAHWRAVILSGFNFFRSFVGGTAFVTTLTQEIVRNGVIDYFHTMKYGDVFFTRN
jgi:hypothetical protein